MKNIPTRRFLGGTGRFVGPSSGTQFKLIVEFLKSYLPIFAKSILKTKIANESGLNNRLSVFITNAAEKEFFFAGHESMEDETKGNSPAADIGIYLKVNDLQIDPPRITAFECKRLTTQLKKLREKEYVIGHELGNKHIKCGGIERFKLSIHAAKLNHAGMIGYIQDGKPDIWQAKINSWILDLCKKTLHPSWESSEQLIKKRMNNGVVSELESIVNRSDDKLFLTHLWINLVQ